MKELEDLVLGWGGATAGAPLMLATVVATTGSTYRKAGAKMLFSEAGRIAGAISGGCLEGELLQTAWVLTENGPTLITYDATAEEDVLWGYGLGCNGTVQVLVERIGPDGGSLAFLERCLNERRAGVMATILAPGGRFGEHVFDVEGLSHSGMGSFEGLSAFFDIIPQPIELVVCGAEHDAGPLAAMAKALGWRVVRVHKLAPADLTADEFIGCAHEQDVVNIPLREGCAVVLMTHNYLRDRFLLRAALTSAALYVGLLGPRVRADRLLQDLRDNGCTFTPEQLGRFHAPIGLDLGADGADEIALAIVAEIQAFYRGRTPSFLRESVNPLHTETACEHRAPTNHAAV